MTNQPTPAERAARLIIRDCFGYRATSTPEYSDQLDAMTAIIEQETACDQMLEVLQGVAEHFVMTSSPLGNAARAAIKAAEGTTDD